MKTMAIGQLRNKEFSIAMENTQNSEFTGTINNTKQYLDTVKPIISIKKIL